MADLVPPVPDDQSLGFIIKNWLFKTRRNINLFVLQLRNVKAQSYTTKGSFLTADVIAGASVINLQDTTDFPTSGTGIIFDPANDRDSFTYTGKTDTTLTGVSGVLTHTTGMTVIPLAKTISMDGPTNETRFYADRGDGTIEELVTIGLYSPGGFTGLLRVGSTNAGTSDYGILAYSNSGNAITGQSISSVGVNGVSTSGNGVNGTAGGSGVGVKAENLSTGVALSCFTSTGYAAVFNGNSTSGHTRWPPLAGRPSDVSAGNVAVIYTAGPGGVDNRNSAPKLMIADGSNWRLVEDYTIWTG